VREPLAQAIGGLAAADDSELYLSWLQRVRIYWAELHQPEPGILMAVARAEVQERLRQVFRVS
jgi:hypothetical protein